MTFKQREKTLFEVSRRFECGAWDENDLQLLKTLGLIAILSADEEVDGIFELFDIRRVQRLAAKAAYLADLDKRRRA